MTVEGTLVLNGQIQILDPKGAGQGQQGGRHTVHVNVGVLERGVHQPHDEVKLLVLEHGLVAHHVNTELLSQRQPRRFRFERSYHCGKCLFSVYNFVLENIPNTVPEDLQPLGRVGHQEASVPRQARTKGHELVSVIRLTLNTAAAVAVI